jgi:NAD(P)-dependent dehydrogenase (short-subunit alcohol dehydrogenase family)
MRSILITGCSSGFGEASALAFARRGDQVFAGLRNLSRGDDLLSVAQAERLPIEPVQLDICDQASIEAGVGQVIKRAGHVDVLLNNAGVAGGGPVEELPEETIRQLFETNTMGALRMIRAVLPSMRERGRGSIVNVSSASARASGPLLGAYAASKAALESFVEALFFEVMDFGISVALIEAGVYRTKIGQNARRHEPPANSPYGDLMERVAASRPRPEDAGDPDEVVETILRAADSPVEARRLRWVVGSHTEALIDAREGDWDSWVERVVREPGRR